MKIYDPVHGFIHFDDLEGELIDTPPFQRLRYIRQLGCTFLIYPGATHTRFEHSLGTMEIASRIYDRIGDDPYWRKIVRMAALCHDMGHLPFSHVAEKAIFGSQGHEQWTQKFIHSGYLKPIWEKLGEHAARDIADIAIGNHALSQIITGDFFGADRIDYLLRDARYTGVSHGHFDYLQLIETIRILDGKLGIEESGLEACEALLMARHFMYRRVYQHSSVKSTSFHLSRFMEKRYKISTIDQLLALTDSEVLHDLRKGEEDALWLTDKSRRFKAFSIDAKTQTKDLKIPLDKIAWDLRPKTQQTIGLAFPVLKASGKIVDASCCSQLSIPQAVLSWVYVDPAYEEELLASIAGPDVGQGERVDASHCADCT